jgi:predicted RNase H-like HicB family nuclease
MEVRQYTVVFEDAGPDGWGAYVPDLPGCTAGGASFEETVRAVQASIELWMKHAVECGEPIPPPSTQGLTLAVAF